MSTADYIYLTFKGLVLNIGFIVCFIPLFKNNFRIATKWVVLIMTFIYVLNILMFYVPYIFGVEAYFAKYDFIDSLLFYIPVFCLIKNNWINSQIEVQVFSWLYNLIGLAIMGIAMVVSGIAAGKMNWYVVSEGSAFMRTAEITSMILAYYVSYLIVKKVSPTILNLQGFSKKFAAVMVFISYVLLFIIGPMLESDIAYRNNPDGLRFIVDSIEIGIAAITIAFIAVKYFKETSRKKKLVQQVVDKYAEDYSEVVELKEEIRELNHELANINYSSYKEDN